MYEKLKYKERAHHLEESEEIVSRTQFQKTGNFSINKGPGEQGGRGASLTEHSLKAQTVVVSKGRPPIPAPPTSHRGVHCRELGNDQSYPRDREEGNTDTGRGTGHCTAYPLCLSESVWGSSAHSPSLCRVGTLAVHGPWLIRSVWRVRQGVGVHHIHGFTSVPPEELPGCEEMFSIWVIWANLLLLPSPRLLLCEGLAGWPSSR